MLLHRGFNLPYRKPLTEHLMPIYIYVLGSRRENACRTYVGWTTDLERRLRQHNTGKGAKSTKGHKWVLLYSERFESRNAAMSREWYVKRDKKFRTALRETI